MTATSLAGEAETADAPGTFYCSELSRRTGERIYGTASEVGVWILLEYTGGWPRQVLPDSDLPQAVKQHVRSAMRRARRTRFCFIKQAPQVRNSGLPGIALFIGVADTPRPFLLRWQLERYEDLLSFDFDSILRGRGAGGEPVAELYLVCTHGKHDKCCAKFGMPVYTAASLHAGSAVWQVSHVGGDRFAGNLVCLPYSIYYGHSDPASVRLRIDAYRSGRITLDGYRGRSSLDFVVQAAEYFLRERTGLLGLDDIQFLALHPAGATPATPADVPLATPAAWNLDRSPVTRAAAVLPEDTWDASFWVQPLQQVHTVRYARDRRAIVSYLTCGMNQDAIPQYQRLG